MQPDQKIGGIKLAPGSFSLPSGGEVFWSGSGRCLACFRGAGLELFEISPLPASFAKTRPRLQAPNWLSPPGLPAESEGCSSVRDDSFDWSAFADAFGDREGCLGIPAVTLHAVWSLRSAESQHALRSIPQMNDLFKGTLDCSIVAVAACPMDDAQAGMVASTARPPHPSLGVAVLVCESDSPGGNYIPAAVVLVGWGGDVSLIYVTRLPACLRPQRTEVEHSGLSDLHLASAREYEHSSRVDMAWAPSLGGFLLRVPGAGVLLLGTTTLGESSRTDRERQPHPMTLPSERSLPQSGGDNDEETYADDGEEDSDDVSLPPDGAGESPQNFGEIPPSLEASAGANTEHALSPQSFCDIVARISRARVVLSEGHVSAMHAPYLHSASLCMKWHGTGNQLLVSHADGSVTVWSVVLGDVPASNEPAPRTPVTVPVLRISLQDDGHAPEVVGPVTLMRWLGTGGSTARAGGTGATLAGGLAVGWACGATRVYGSSGTVLLQEGFSRIQDAEMQEVFEFSRKAKRGAVMGRGAGAGAGAKPGTSESKESPSQQDVAPGLYGTVPPGPAPVSALLSYQPWNGAGNAEVAGSGGISYVVQNYESAGSRQVLHAAAGRLELTIVYAMWPQIAGSTPPPDDSMEGPKATASADDPYTKSDSGYARIHREIPCFTRRHGLMLPAAGMSAALPGAFAHATRRWAVEASCPVDTATRGYVCGSAWKQARKQSAEFDALVGRGLSGSMQLPALLLPGGAWLPHARVGGGVIGEANAALGSHYYSSSGSTADADSSIRFWMQRQAHDPLYLSMWGHVHSVVPGYGGVGTSTDSGVREARQHGSPESQTYPDWMCVGRRGLVASSTRDSAAAKSTASIGSASEAGAMPDEGMPRVHAAVVLSNGTRVAASSRSRDRGEPGLGPLHAAEAWQDAGLKFERPPSAVVTRGASWQAVVQPWGSAAVAGALGSPGVTLREVRLLFGEDTKHALWHGDDRLRTDESVAGILDGIPLSRRMAVDQAKASDVTTSPDAGFAGLRMEAWSELHPLVRAMCDALQNPATGTATDMTTASPSTPAAVGRAGAGAGVSQRDSRSLPTSSHYYLQVLPSSVKVPASILVATGGKQEAPIRGLRTTNILPIPSVAGSQRPPAKYELGRLIVCGVPADDHAAAWFHSRLETVHHSSALDPSDGSRGISGGLGTGPAAARCGAVMMLYKILAVNGAPSDPESSDGVPRLVRAVMLPREFGTPVDTVVLQSESVEKEAPRPATFGPLTPTPVRTAGAGGSARSAASSSAGSIVEHWPVIGVRSYSGAVAVVRFSRRSFETVFHRGITGLWSADVSAWTERPAATQTSGSDAPQRSKEHSTDNARDGRGCAFAVMLRGPGLSCAQAYQPSHAQQSIAYPSTQRLPNPADHQQCAVAVIAAGDDCAVALRSALPDAGLSSWLGSESVPCGMHAASLSLLSLSNESEGGADERRILTRHTRGELMRTSSNSPDLASCPLLPSLARQAVLTGRTGLAARLLSTGAPCIDQSPTTMATRRRCAVALGAREAPAVVLDGVLQAASSRLKQAWDRLEPAARISLQDIVWGEQGQVMVPIAWERTSGGGTSGTEGGSAGGIKTAVHMGVDEFLHGSSGDGPLSSEGDGRAVHETTKKSPEGSLRDGSVAWAQGAKQILDGVLGLLQRRSDYVGTVAMVARGSDSATLPILFPLAGHPVQLIMRAIREGNLRSAAMLLSVVESYVFTRLQQGLDAGQGIGVHGMPPGTPGTRGAGASRDRGQVTAGGISPDLTAAAGSDQLRRGTGLLARAEAGRKRAASGALASKLGAQSGSSLPYDTDSSGSSGGLLSYVGLGWLAEGWVEAEESHREQVHGDATPSPGSASGSHSASTDEWRAVQMRRTRPVKYGTGREAAELTARHRLAAVSAALTCQSMLVRACLARRSELLQQAGKIRESMKVPRSESHEGNKREGGGVSSADSGRGDSQATDALADRALVAQAIRMGDYDAADKIARARKLQKEATEVDNLRLEMEAYGMRLREACGPTA